AAYRARFRSAPGTWAPYTYDSVRLLARAATRAKSFSAAALTTALNATTGWKGWTGTVTFEPETGNRVPAPVTVNTSDADGAFHVDANWAVAIGFNY
ncbi:MAG: ABC transporter substrate-binding protein, partial [Actinomycetes bacterium]